MRAYGCPRNDDFENPDAADLRAFARPARVGRMPGSGGDTRCCFRSSQDKARTRRYFKRRARAEGKKLTQQQD